MESEQIMCTRCVMDTTDRSIYFNTEGVCNHCLEFDAVTAKRWYPNKQGAKQLEKIIDEIKSNRKSGNKKNQYDCILGLSGGLDSSYLALKIKEYGLRPLVVHVDAGWNSELAVFNIEQIVKHCNYDLHTIVMNWNEMRDLQLAYIKAGIANQDVPQDHAFFASLYNLAAKENISYVISGGNIATESVFPSSWHHSAMDAINLKDIHRTHGTRRLKQYKTVSFWKYYFYYPFIKRIKVLRPLNYLPYSKDLALKELKEKVGYKEYGRKHGESRFTKFFQNYYLPKKFDMDKRKPHLSSLILAGLISRRDAIRELSKPLYEEQELEADKAYVAKKLKISLADLDKYIEQPLRNYDQYRNWDKLYNLMKTIQKITSKVFGRDFRKYS